MSETFAVKGGITLNVLIYLLHNRNFHIPHMYKMEHECLKYELFSFGKLIDFCLSRA